MRMVILLMVTTLFILMGRLQWRLAYKSLFYISISHSLVYIQVYCDMEGINCDGEVVGLE